MRTVLFLVVLVALAVNASQVCKTETFAAGCNFNLPQGTTILDGAATVQRTIGSSPLQVFVPGDENCELNLGACSSFEIDTTHPILAGVDNGYQLSIVFNQKFRSFSIGKLYGSGLIMFQFLKNGNVVLSDQIDRTNLNCLVGSSRTWSPLGGFDKILISGSNVFALTDLQACKYGASLFTGGVGGYTPIFEDTCVHCVDALRINYWKRYTCNDSGSCQTRTYLGANCSSISFAIPTLNIQISFLQLVFPVRNTVCVVTSNVPAPLQSREDGGDIHEEL